MKQFVLLFLLGSGVTSTNEALFAQVTRLRSDQVPIILVDEGQNNVRGEEDKTSAIAWIEAHGFEVSRRSGRFNWASLDSVHVVISALPLSDQNAFKSHPPSENTASWCLPRWYATHTMARVTRPIIHKCY